MCFIGCGIAKLYSILFSTFWLLFICSFIGTEISDVDQAKTIYSNVMMVSVVFGMLLVPLVGKMADTIDPRFMMPFAFMCRAGAIVLFCFIKDPSNIYSYCVSVCLVLGTVLENITIDVVLLRNADK
jgi:MFS-type transporter involved in bile tolerance (Atg22 family)